MSRRPTRRDVIRTGCTTALASLAGCHGQSADSGAGGFFGGDEPTDQGVVWQRSLDRAPRELATDPGPTALYGNARRGAPFAFDLDGDEQWQRDVDGRIAAVTEDRVVLADSSTVTALEAASGSEEWSFSTERHEIVQELSSATDLVYFVGEKRATAETDPDEEFVRLYALDESTGDVVWQLDLLPEPDSRAWSLDATDGYVLAAWAGGAIRRFDADGSERWRTPVALDDVESDGQSEGFTRYRFSSGVFHDGTYYFGIRDGPGQAVFALAPDDGAMQWKRGGYQRVQAVDDGRVYCHRAGEHVQHQIAALDAATGDEGWTTEVPSSRMSDGAAFAADVLYVSTFENRDDADPAVVLRAFDAVSGEPRAAFTVPGNRITAPVAAAGRVFVGTGTRDSTSQGAVDEGTLHALTGIHADGEW